MNEEQVFVGGIAFTVRITRLAAGASITIQPSHYNSKTGCVVMAAGNARRFGENKLVAELDGRSLIRRTLEAIPAEEFTCVTVVTQYKEIEALAEAFATLSARTLQYVDQVQRVTAEKERIGAELSMATDIQASQLPRLFPAFPNRPEFDVYARMTPAREVGGDFYDFFLVDDDHIGLVMADVSGKGVPAALFMMISRVLIKSHLQNGETPGEALENVNDQLCEGNETELFVTVWVAVLEISTGKGIAANAGHEHPALRRANGQYELAIYRHSPAVATLEGIPYKEHTFQLNPGDSLFVYTDGVAEATSAEKELFGTDRMLEALNRDPDAKPEDVLKNVMDGINAFVADAEQFDDITMLCLKYVGKQ
jgi:sigma-B regulation protein RsbU (phosphoserine phosphatase)